jgi:hypothetical protein
MFWGRSPAVKREAEEEWGPMTSMKSSTTKPVPQYTWQGFIAYAESFGHAAVHVSNGTHLMHNAPVGALACHCLELSLKAVLLSRSYCRASTELRFVLLRS